MTGPSIAADADTRRLLLLHVVRVTGLADAAAGAEFAGISEDEARAGFAAAVADGLALERSGRLQGFALTPAGREWHATALVADTEARGARAAVEQCYEGFTALNGPFKEICTDWQVRDGQPNDHSDAEYDAAVIARLGDLHRRTVDLTTTAAQTLPRFGWYPRRFTAAWDRLAAGELRAFAAPLAHSYHDVWMALHQDLMSSLGLTRSARDGH
jgi:hypothetical protein